LLSHITNMNALIIIIIVWQSVVCTVQIWFIMYLIRTVLVDHFSNTGNFL